MSGMSKRKETAAAQSEIMELPEVLETLGVGRTTLYKLIKEGRIAPLPKSPLIKRAARLRFRRADVEALRG